MKKSNEPTKTKSKMKKTIKFLSMAALALVGAMTAGCSSDDNIISQPQQPENKNNVVTLTTTVGLDGGATTRALTSGGVKTFAVGDQIAVVYENTSNTMVKAESVALTEGNITAEGKSATFTVTLTDPKASGTVKYIYPAAMAGETDVDYTKLNSQDGTLETIASKYDLAVYEGNLTSDVKLPASASLENKLAIIAYTIKDNAATPNDLTSTITGMIVSDGTNNYTISGKDADGHIYAAIQPTSGANIEYTATDGTKNYIKFVTDKTYAAGQFYQLGLKMAATGSAPAGATAVDLGLSVKWANMNVGATSESDYGLFFAWGETTGYSNSSGSDHNFSWTNYSMYKTADTTTKYNTQDNKTVLHAADDAATVNWGNSWRMPTYAELNELFATKSNSNYTWTWTTVDGHKGYRITRKSNGASIFLPASGYRVNNQLNRQNEYGYYWSSSLLEAIRNNGYLLFISGTSEDKIYNDSRHYGRCVRAVQKN